MGKDEVAPALQNIRQCYILIFELIFKTILDINMSPGSLRSSLMTERHE